MPNLSEIRRFTLISHRLPSCASIATFDTRTHTLPTYYYQPFNVHIIATSDAATLVPKNEAPDSFPSEKTSSDGDGAAEGPAVGAWEGLEVGADDGLRVGTVEGIVVGAEDGVSDEGAADGTTEGEPEGDADGSKVEGACDGTTEGAYVGAADGTGVGEVVGDADGASNSAVQCT